MTVYFIRVNPDKISTLGKTQSVGAYNSLHELNNVLSSTVREVDTLSAESDRLSPDRCVYGVVN